MNTSLKLAKVVRSGHTTVYVLDSLFNDLPNQLDITKAYLKKKLKTNKTVFPYILDKKEIIISIIIKRKRSEDLYQYDENAVVREL